MVISDSVNGFKLVLSRAGVAFAADLISLKIFMTECYEDLDERLNKYISSLIQP